jgi:hypothetical protein
MCQRRISPHGRKETEKGRQEEDGDKVSLWTCPLVTYVLLRFPEPPKIVPPAGDLGFNKCGGHFILNPS